MHALATTATDLDLVRADVQGGFSSIVTLEGPRGLAWLEIMGPNGMRPANDALAAAVPTVRLWVPPDPGAPLAVAAANRSFDADLRRLEEQARPHLFDADLAWLGTLLRVVRDAVPRRQMPRVPRPGDAVRVEGQASVQAWASCLTLADLQAALQKALA